MMKTMEMDKSWIIPSIIIINKTIRGKTNKTFFWNIMWGYEIHGHNNEIYFGKYISLNTNFYFPIFIFLIYLVSIL